MLISRISKCLAVVLLAAQPSWAVGPSLSSNSGAGTCSAVVPSYGTVYKYNTGYPSKYIVSDIFVNTWADDGNYYDANDDSLGWQGATASNVQISQISTIVGSTMTGININAMASWGTNTQTGTDGATYKANGIISVAGKLYVDLSRQVYNSSTPPYQQTSANGQIIMSSNHGGTWTPTPPSTAQPYTSPEFAGTPLATLSFVQYGQNYSGQSDSLADTYVYGTYNDGFWNNGNILYLARVAITNMPNLSAANWSVYTGGDGTLSANWSSTFANAVPILLPGAYKLSGLSQMQYYPSLGRTGCYVLMNWWYPSVVTQTSLDASNTTWQLYAGPHPWALGPIGSPKTWNTSGSLGLYSPNVMPASISPSGSTVTATILTAGDFFNENTSTGDATLTVVPLTLTQN